MRKSSSSYSNSRNQHTQVNFHHRFMFLLVIFGLFISVIFGFLYYYQIYEHKHYNTLSETNRIKYITTLPTRGNIYDRNGKLLANNLPMYSLDINIEDVKNSDQLISLLKKHIKISNKEIEKFNDRKKKSKAKIVTLKNHLTDSEVAELLAVRHNYSGFQISGSLLRNYNYSKEMSHVLGTVGYVDESDIEIYKGDKYQNAKFVGKTGLEKFYNDPLYGNPGFEIVERLDKNLYKARTLGGLPRLSDVENTKIKIYDKFSETKGNLKPYNESTSNDSRFKSSDRWLNSEFVSVNVELAEQNFPVPVVFDLPKPKISNAVGFILGNLIIFFI